MRVRSVAAFLALAAAVVLGGCGSRYQGDPSLEPVHATAVPVEVSEAGGPVAIDASGLDLTAAELLMRSDQAMLELQFFRIFIDDPGHGFGLQEFAGPGLLQPLVFTDVFRPGGVPEYRHYVLEVGPRADADIFSRSSGRPRADNMDIDSGAQDVRVIGTDRVAGRDAWVLWYRQTAPSAEGPFTRWITEWIDQETHWLLRQEPTNNDPYGSPMEPVKVLFDFNDPSAPRRYPTAVPDARPQPLLRTIAVRDSEDTFINEREPDANFAGGTILEAEGAPWQRSLLRFEVDGIPEDAHIVSAYLALYVTEAYFTRDHDGPQRLGAIHEARGAWRASEVTWSTAPPLGARLGTLSSTLGYPSAEPVDYSESWVQAEVTSAVTGNGMVDFYLINEWDLTGAEFAASEYEEYAPTLLITYEYGDPLLVPTATP